jgi:hypothetical protein
MKTSHLLTSGAVLAVGGFVCTMFAFGTQITPLQDGAAAKQIDHRRECVNARVREPVLIYDATGSTLLGPSHTQLSVYSDGLTTLSRIDPLNPGSGRVAVRMLSTEAVDALASTLAAAGAGALCDDPLSVADMPLSTITVFGLPGMGAASRTFSYWEGLSGPTLLVDSILQGFVQAEFAAF